jgi:three-Cys-motif partner protein
MSENKHYVSKDWIKSKLQRLRESSTDLWNVAPDVTNDFSSWSALKLILLAATVDMYTSIIPKHRDNFYYIDALAGSGISAFPEDDENFVGSPIIAATMAHEEFNRMYFIEQDAEKATALRERLEYVEENLSKELQCDDYRIIPGNTNNEMDDIIEEIRQETLYQGETVNTLSFVDNQGLDVHYSTLEKITEIHGDLLINLPTIAVRRTAGADYKTSMNNFYGNSAWEAAKDDDALRTIYMSRLAELNRPVQEFIPVRSGGQFYYDMIYCTRETQGGSPYIQVLEDMEDKISQLTGEDIERVLRFMRGEQTALDIFGDDDEDEQQTGLGDFMD